MTKMHNQGGVVDRADNERCWASLRVRHMPATWAQCGLRARPGHLTCHHHQDRELAAQAARKRAPKGPLYRQAV